jgi:hypothetical protein
MRSMEPDSAPIRVPLARPQSYWPLFLIFAVPALLAVILFAAMFLAGGDASVWDCVILALPIAAILLWLRRQHWDLRDWSTVPFLDLDGERMRIRAAGRFNPGKAPVEVPFPRGSHLEYHNQYGDLVFDNDGGQHLGYVLKVIRSDRTKSSIEMGYITGIQPNVAAENLQKHGIGFHLIRDYDGQHGEHSETELTAQSSAGKYPGLQLLLGTSSIWLGFIAGWFVRSLGITILIGVTGFVLVTLFLLLTSNSRRATVVHLLLAIPSYGLTYAAVTFALRTTRHS